MTPDEVRAMIADGTISGGMIPKVETALKAVEEGRARRGDPGWPGAECLPAGTVHRTRRGVA
jgi:hypothetical protein